MINHLKDYDKITSTNAKMLALRAQQKAIEEEISNILSRNFKCQKCGYLMPIETYNERKSIHLPDPYNEEDKYIEFCNCPCCGELLYGR